EVVRDSKGTATSLWAITRIINLFVILRIIRWMPHFTCLFYSYAILGMWLFRGVIVAPPDWHNKDFPCGSFEQSNYWANNFDDFYSSVVVLYDIMLINNWGTFLTGIRSFTTRWSQLYFVSWWFISNVYILALVLGFIVELFSLNVARIEENIGGDGSSQTYFVKTLFHLFKRSLREPSDDEINFALKKYKRLYQNTEEDDHYTLKFIILCFLLFMATIFAKIFGLMILEICYDTFFFNGQWVNEIREVYMIHV
ncbi:unnamed protein product, partial [Didymodactylos carnosus]